MNNPADSTATQHPSTLEAYTRHGWFLVPIPLGQKGPSHPNWNKREACSVHPGHTGNIGLAHSYSGTVAIDIDDWETAKEVLAEHGIDLDQLYNAPDAVTIESGKTGHGKLLYAMPMGIPLPSKKMIDSNKKNYLDFRCATSNGLTVQDVLPPSIHPDTGQPYRWGGYGHWSRLPVIPMGLLNFWQELLEPTQPESTQPTSSKPADIDWDLIRNALMCIPADVDRDQWVSIGMALHWAGCQTYNLNYAFELWDTWSKGNIEHPATKYKGQKDLLNSWRSFKPDGGISIGTVYKMAQSYGWTFRQESAEKIFEGVKTTEFSWTEAFTVSIEEAEQISDPDWIIQNLIIKGHMIVIPAPANGGKTTIMFHLSGEMADKGYQVYYVNADVSGGDAKQMIFEAKKCGFTLMLPDMKVGKSMEDILESLQSMNETGTDFSKAVFIFDTLKKMVEVINKSKAKQLYKLLRSLTAKRMTIVLLGHTNKYPDANGNLVFEGTGDLRTDVDEMIYMTPQKHPDGSITVSTNPDKVRGAFEPITFHISPDRKVTLKEQYVDVTDVKRREKHRQDDQAIIEGITEAIQADKTKQIEIFNHCKECHHLSKRQVRPVLDRYSFLPDKLWNREKAPQNNAWVYSLEGVPVLPQENGISTQPV